MFLKMVQAVCLGLLVAVFHGGIAHAAPTSVMAALSWSGAGVDLTIAWTNGASPVLQQYVELSRDNNGWAPGTFTLHGPLAASVNSMHVPVLSLGAPPYYVRINQLLGNGVWEASETLTVTTNNLTANTCASTAAVPAAAATPAPAAVTPPPIAPAAASTPDPVVAVTAPAPPEDELTAWLRSLGVLDMPTVHTFVQNAVSAYQQPAVTWSPR
jgi:hypothetical protein